ncbi:MULTISPECIES: ArsR/SmtB family transcription factor [Mycolicibacterium]|uniref:Transcriptional regulator, ArsR family n=3 Tax=Mycolicibacterium gilvum TaxID=1804 RepID=E6TMJ1_MYCSR|nr:MULTISPECIES: metalloregulator ArsR/SmtB family transcription factor [Mycolicibacterium]ABP43602.1 transcriptional regulator, ArsR family [Mycolicibacterium gilvum PYR-GCK]ADU01597.1 transcriptional regulator, ArsR family [Mycolicibacterium gilvum Spyr1]MBV5242144.1 metalloregulator ArsR/SmtB family transcription factor [Mycolicibacterium sp. PAM1]MCV7053914.1 winged helix-turn-helix transcriptional regulator [Mycolicibacterium gilvum]STZ46173.1 regulatory protein ArsR [Mycolicibacterium gi
MPHRSPAEQQRPLYEIKANLFKALAHPARIRVLEILATADDPVSVSDMLADTGFEATLLSQHLAVLKKHQVVTARRVGNSVFYELAHPLVSELLVIARTFLADTLAGRRDQLRSIKALPPLPGRA